jgi:hypothetical protein
MSNTNNKDLVPNGFFRAQGKKHAVWANNQVVFRKFNERIIDVRSDLKQAAKENGKLESVSNDDDMSSFICECSDENCTMKIHLSLNDYQNEHARDDTFTVATHHEVTDIEKTIDKMPDYIVVQKLETPSQSADRLHKTDVNNI